MTKLWVALFWIMIVVGFPYPGSATEREVANLVYIIIDGASRKSLYQLLDKNRLPGLAELKERGNLRNMDIVGHKSETRDSYAELLTGYYQELLMPENQELYPRLPKEKSVVEHLKMELPNLKIGVILSSPQNLDAPTPFKSWLSPMLKKADYVAPEDVRTSSQVASQITQFISSADTPFFILANFTDVEYAGHRYRDGALAYSDAFKWVDRGISSIIKTLKKQGVWDQTHIIVTTNYGFNPNSRSHQEVTESWIICTQKTQKKGTQSDIVPSIYELFHINWSTWVPPLPGKSLFY